MNTLFAWPIVSTSFSVVGPILREDVRGSPPRKTARLDGDIDSSARGKGKQHVQDAVHRGIINLAVVHSNAGPPSLPLADNSSFTNPIHHALRILLDRDESIPFLPSSYKTVFDAVEIAVCLAGKGADVYQMLTREFDRACAEGIARRLSTGAGLPWLHNLVDEWRWFESRVDLIRALFTWLDRSYVSLKDVLSIKNLGYKIFNQRVFSGNVIIHDKLAPCIKEWANSERTAGGVASPHRPYIKTLISMLQILGLYGEDCSKPYIQAIHAFYTAESAALSSNLTSRLSPVAFVSHCVTRVAQEVQRCRDVLPEESLLPVEQATESALMNDRVPWLMRDGVPHLVDVQDMVGLRKMYNLCERVDELESFKAAFARSIETTVARIVLPVAAGEEMVPQLLAFKSFIDLLLASAFEVEAQSDDAASSSGLTGVAQKRGKGPFGYAATDAFAKGFGKRQRKPAEMIAKFIDKAMRKGQKGGSDRDFNDSLDAVLALYQFTRDRDVFRTFYWRALAKRLLLQRSASDDFEKAVIKKLRDGYDPEFGKGDEMFKDLALSKDLLTEFHEKWSDEKTFSVMVLQYSCWPYQPKKGRDIDLPTSMLFSVERYSEFYKSKHKQRKLDWFHSLGTVTLTARFPKGEKELSVSLYQASVLLLFNNSIKLGYTEVQQQTNMGDEDLRRTLQSLACGKKRILKKLPPGKDVNDTDNFQYNEDFVDPNRKIHINSIQQKESIEESRATDEKIQEDRCYLLDAAIVRIMKEKKRMTNQALITETVVVVKSHFLPDVRQIKKQIDSLTDREYIRRDEDNRDVYHYIA
ncbi:Cullin-4B [Hysterangium stoloniferum]|nr:Cullin-4B [Hysterangium stoloniferum]